MLQDGLFPEDLAKPLDAYKSNQIGGWRSKEFFVHRTHTYTHTHKHTPCMGLRGLGAPVTPAANFTSTSCCWNVRRRLPVKSRPGDITKGPCQKKRILVVVYNCPGLWLHLRKTRYMCTCVCERLCFWDSLFILATTEITKQLPTRGTFSSFLKGLFNSSHIEKLLAGLTAFMNLRDEVRKQSAIP